MNVRISDCSSRSWLLSWSIINVSPDRTHRMRMSAYHFVVSTAIFRSFTNNKSKSDDLWEMEEYSSGLTFRDCT